MGVKVSSHKVSSKKFSIHTDHYVLKNTYGGKGMLVMCIGVCVGIMLLFQFERASAQKLMAPPVVERLPASATQFN